MTHWVETAMVLLILSDLALLGVSLLVSCFRIFALQGILLAAFTLLIHTDGITARAISLSIGILLLKGIIFPLLLTRTMQKAGVRLEMDPYVGYVKSLAIGMAMLGAALWLGRRIVLPANGALPLVVPAALFTLFVGIFLVIMRRLAITQVLGYLVLENGIYAFGIAAVGNMPALVELGVLLDAFVAVLVMGIAVHQIRRTFEHMDTNQMDTLKG